MAPTVVSLGRMVDLALGTPEVGSVNFNVLHTLLHAVIQKLNIADFTADLPEDEGIYGRAHTRLSGVAESSRDLMDFESDSGLTGFRSASGTGSDDRKSSGLKKSSSIPVTRSAYHCLEEKVERLDRQIAGLQSLPTTNELMEMTAASSAHEDNKFPRPVAEMWQSMQLSRKVDANTQGVSKLMSLVEDLMREMQLTKDAAEEFERKLRRITDDTVDQGKRLTELSNKLDGLEKYSKEFQERLNSLPGDDFLAGFVTWSALEDALNGLRQQFDSQKKQTEMKQTLLEAGNQTEELAWHSPRHLSRSSTPGPSAQLQDLLERLGRLHADHDSLEKRVEHLEVGMKDKDEQSGVGVLRTAAETESGSQSEGVVAMALSIPLAVDRASPVELSHTMDVSDEIIGDINQQLKTLLNGFEALKNARTSEHNSDESDVLRKLQNEYDRLQQVIQRLSDDVTSHATEIKQLNEQANDLEKNKADKELVLGEINAKADKAHLDLKVNRNHFDLTCKELNQMISDLINKLLGNEGEWKNVVGQLASEIDTKMGRLEFGPFRDELERQLRALAGKLSTLQSGEMNGLNEDDAAGIRKQLLQRFHCISCDKPLDMGSHKPIPSLPEQPGFRESRSMRPYLVYDLDQIRQYARSQGTVDGSVVDLYGSSRPCGGSHTLTHQHRRIMKLQPAREPSFINKNNTVGGATKLPNLQVPKSKSAYPLHYSTANDSNPAPQASARPSTTRLSTPRQTSQSSHRPVVTVMRSVTAAPAARRSSFESSQDARLNAAQSVASIQLPPLTAPGVRKDESYGDDGLRSNHPSKGESETKEEALRADGDDAVGGQDGGRLADDADRHDTINGDEKGADVEQ